jgi:hypothetical protein
VRQVKKKNIIIKIAFAMAAGLHWVVAWPCRALSKVCDVLVGPLNWSVRLALLCVILGCVTGWCGLRGFGAYMKWVDFLPLQQDWFDASGLAESARTLSIGLQLTACGLLLGALLAFFRRRFAYHLLKVAAAAYVVMWLGVLRLTYMIPSAMFLSDEKVLSKELRNYLWVYCTWAWLPFFLLGLLLLLCLCFSDVTRYYRGKNQEGVLLGDRIMRSLRTHGDDPTFRVSSYWSTFLHIFVIFMIPLLLGRGCRQKPYGIPKGIGQPVMQMVQVKRVKPKPKERYVFNPNNAISYYVPEIDKDSEVREEVEEETLNTYAASDVNSGLGKGGPGKGGWPNGMENAKVRFIRLRYAGGDWDQQMGKGSDYNFLLKFHEETKFKIASNTEAIRIVDLKFFPKHRAPPFVYLTGKGNISVSAAEIKTLRWYLLEEGGMIFADNGGKDFHGAFQRLMRRVLPEKQWIDISNDDILYRQPYTFSHGAPPLWHHSGNRAMGLKHNGRWVVFYHQGDINDAWQDGGNGISKSIRKAAFRMGINVVNYSFNQYLSLHYGE